MAYYYPTVFLCVIKYFIFGIVANPQTLNDILFNGNYEFIDLTYPFDNNTVYWPRNEKFKFTRMTREFRRDGSWFAINAFAENEHDGTHMDAPYHFQVNGLRLGEIPLDKLIVTLVVVDVTSIVNDDPNFVLQKHHLNYNFLKYNSGKPFVIIFKFGWSKFYYDRKKYLGLCNDTLNFPGLSEELAKLLISSYKNLVGIGIDTASVDPGSVTDFPVHKVVTGAGLFNLENVKLDVTLPDYGCTALILPMKIAQGTGGPLRLVAICPIKNPTRCCKH